MIEEDAVEAIIKAIIKIGNHKKVLEICEPNIFSPQELKGWMVIRTLYSLRLLEDEIYKDA